uniref:Exocyst complex protein EXO70 n=1 Tax=Blastobotrys adeninivorans TaxID=409370 RepID=A0A060TFP2_BLAAD
MELETVEVEFRVLEETLSKVDSLTESVAGSLGELSKSGSKAERAIQPISGKTYSMAVYGKNLEASLRVIEGIKGYAKLSAECEKVINQGPGLVGAQNYAKSISKLDKALGELKGSPMSSFHKVVSKMEALILKGRGAFQEDLVRTLDRAYNPIDAAGYVTQERRMPTVNPEETAILRELIEYFINANDPKDSLYIGKVTNYMLSSVAELGKSVQPKQRVNKGNYERGSNPIHIYTAALKGLLMAEAENLSHLFSHRDNIRMYYFDEIAAGVGAEFVKTVNGASDHVRRNMTTDSLMVFELIECTGILITAIQTISKRVPTVLNEAMKRLQSMAHEVFTEFLKYIDTRIQNMQQLPPESGVSDATIDIMSRMGRLADYKASALISISALSGPGAWIPTPKPAWASILPPASSGPTKPDPMEMLSSYFSDAIDALLLGLEMKSKAAGRKNPQVGLFVLTNLALVERFATKSDVYLILGESGGDRIERLRKRALNMFLESWKATASNLMDQTIVRPGSKQLSSKDREAIKEKFKSFNSEFEALVQQHRNYKISDKLLNETLVKEISFICPLYHRFYDRHCGGDFSKNVDKYIKYDKRQFDEKIESLKK